MKTQQIISINFKKFKKYRKQALFLVIPIAFLVFLSLVISSQVKNIQVAVEESVFGTVEEQNTLIKLHSRDSERYGGGMFSLGIESYTENDVASIKTIKNVEDVIFRSSLPLNNIKTDDLFEEKEINIYNFTALSEGFAKLFTEDPFIYQEGEAIPIILNINTFLYRYEDWGDKTEIEVPFSPQDFKNESIIQEAASDVPIKQVILDYDKSEIIGQKINVKIGGLSAVPAYNMVRTEDGVKFNKYSDEEIAESEEERKSNISQYWDYEKISTPLAYTFEIVGLIENENDNSIYIPEDFASVVMSDYYQNEIEARNETEMPLDMLDNNFTGPLYDGTELTSQTGFVGRGRMVGIIPPGTRGMIESRDSDSESESYSYEIPGLVIKIAREDSNDGLILADNILGQYTVGDAYNEAVKMSDTLLIKITSILDRGQVTDDLNAMGFTYQDLVRMDVIEEIKTTLRWISSGTIIGFIVFSILIIIYTMTKFVSEGKKEIGIFRALGSTKKDIRTMFTIQGILYTLIGYMVGAVLGVIAMYSLSGLIKGAFDSFVGKTIEESFNVVNAVEPGLFSNIDFTTFGIYSAILLVITIVVTLIPSNHAANIDPVDAIRNE